MTHEIILLYVIIIIDLAMWWEARQSGNIMKLYFKERAKWYERRYKIQNAKIEKTKPAEVKDGLGKQETTAN